MGVFDSYSGGEWSSLHEETSETGLLRCCGALSSALYEAVWEGNGNGFRVKINASEAQFEHDQSFLVVGEWELEELVEFINTIRKKQAAETRAALGFPAIDPIDEPPRLNAAGSLLCPYCGSFNLHHEIIKVLSRIGEDGPGAIVIRDGTSAVAEGLDASDPHFNPTRRNYLDIVLSCEGCGPPQPLVLRIRQHKRATVLSWVTEKPL